MATHFICQPTEPLPHKYPVVRKCEKTHGAVSDYEVFNLGNKQYTQFPPVGWDTSQSSEESIPLCQAPAPSWKANSNFIGPDPDLCITPEKPTTNKKQGHKLGVCPKPTQHERVYPIGPDPELCITPEKSLESVSKSKTQHRVRFEVDNSEAKTYADQISEDEQNWVLNTSGGGKTYKPGVYCGDDNLDSDRPEKQDKSEYKKSKQYVVISEEGKPKYVELKDHGLQNSLDSNTLKFSAPVLPVVQPSDQGQIPEGKTITVNPKISKSKQKKQKQMTADGIVVNEKIQQISKDSHSGPGRRVRVTRETKERPIQTDYKFPFSEDGGVNVLEHVFNRPEYNSTLRMRRELEEIKDSQVDLARALDKKLNMSETKQNEIREKAAYKVDVTEDKVKLTGLVSLSVPVDSIRTQKENEKKARVKPIKHSKPQVSKTGREPDLTEFFTADLQRETAELSIPGLSIPSESLSTASHRTAFDLYRHNRVWNCTSHFRSGR